MKGHDLRWASRRIGAVSFQDLLDKTCASAAESAELVLAKVLEGAGELLAILIMKPKTSVANRFQVSSELRWLT